MAPPTFQEWATTWHPRVALPFNGDYTTDFGDGGGGLPSPSPVPTFAPGFRGRQAIQSSTGDDTGPLDATATQQSVVMLVYIPDLSASAGLWSKGGNISGQFLWVSAGTVNARHRTSSTNRELVSAPITAGWHTVGAKFSNAAGVNALYIDGQIADSVVTATSPVNGTADPKIGNNNVFGFTTPIDGTGILISHFVWENSSQVDEFFSSFHYSMFGGATVPFADQLSNATLGCAEEYTVIITARDLVTYAGQVQWSALSWSRVLDEISTASVTVPDVFGGLRCNIEFGDAVVPWRFGIRIERNGELVWAGPIVEITRPVRDGAGADYVEIQAEDKMVWTTRRTPTTSTLYTDQDGGTVFQGVLEDAVALDNIFNLLCPTFETGYQMTREILALDFEYSYDILQELANSAVDFFVIGNELAVQNAGGANPAGWYVIRDGVQQVLAPTTDTYGRYIFGLFTDEAWTARPGFTMDGRSQANNILVPGADSGEAGFRLFWTAADVDALDGLLTYVDVNTLYRPQEGIPIVADGVFQERAYSLLAWRRNVPIVVSGGTLSQSAPVTIGTLFPGSLWAIDLAETGLSQLLDVQRLKRIDVTVQISQGGIMESVAPTLIPLGTDESGGG